MGIAWPFVLLQTVPLLLGPVLARLLRGSGRACCWWPVCWRWPSTAVAGRRAVSATGLAPILGVLALNGIGFVLLVSGLTAAMVNAVPVELAGMASGNRQRGPRPRPDPRPGGDRHRRLEPGGPVAGPGNRGQPAAQAVFAAGGPIAVAGARLGRVSTSRHAALATATRWAWSSPPSRPSSPRWSRPCSCGSASELVSYVHNGAERAGVVEGEMIRPLPYGVRVLDLLEQDAMAAASGDLSRPVLELPVLLAMCGCCRRWSRRRCATS